MKTEDLPPYLSSADGHLPALESCGEGGGTFAAPRLTTALAKRRSSRLPVQRLQILARHEIAGVGSRACRPCAAGFGEQAQHIANAGLALGR